MKWFNLYPPTLKLLLLLLIAKKTPFLLADASEEEEEEEQSSALLLCLLQKSQKSVYVSTCQLAVNTAAQRTADSSTASSVRCTSLPTNVATYSYYYYTIYSQKRG